MSEKDIERARLGKALLDNPLFTEILDGLKGSYAEAWLSSRPEDVETRERLYLQSLLVDEVRREIRIAVENGEIAKAIIKRREQRQ